MTCYATLLKEEILIYTREDIRKVLFRFIAITFWEGKCIFNDLINCSIKCIKVLYKRFITT
jgi:hypothetical protein